jgi:hypothetical protein
MKSPCILVGNGTSLLDAARGSEIDEHECVVRFNSFTLGAFAAHTGIRSDVWFTVHSASPTCPRTHLPWRKVWCHSWEPNAEKCKVFQSHREYRTGDNLSKIDHDLLNDIAGYSRTGFKYWSTGLLAIWAMLQQYATVTITGFDWWERQAHHYNDKAVRGTLHKPELERDCIEQLAAEGRLHFL